MNCRVHIALLRFCFLLKLPESFLWLIIYSSPYTRHSNRKQTLAWKSLPEGNLRKFKSVSGYVAAGTGRASHFAIELFEIKFDHVTRSVAINIGVAWDKNISAVSQRCFCHCMKDNRLFQSARYVQSGLQANCLKLNKNKIHPSVTVVCETN